MSWKYLNPGDYRLLDNYTTNSSYMMNYVNNKTIAPVTGIAFATTESIPNYPIKTPTGLKEIWIAFTVFGTSREYSTSYHPCCMLYGATSLSTNKSFCFYIGAKYTTISINGSSVYYQQIFAQYSLLNRVWLHVKSGVSDGFAEVYINNKKIYASYNRNVMNGEDILVYQFRTRYLADALSDIILADEPIDKDEHVAALPVSLTTAEGWIYDAVNNIYTTDSTNKSIWQVPDVNQLKKEVGLDNPSITSVAIQAYNVSTNDTLTVDSLQKRLIQNNQAVLIDSADISSDNNFISSAMLVNPITNSAWTLNDLSSIQLGVTTAKST